MDKYTTDLLEKMLGIGAIPALGKLFQSKMVVPFIDDYDFDQHSGIGPNAEKP